MVQQDHDDRGETRVRGELRVVEQTGERLRKHHQHDCGGQTDNGVEHQDVHDDGALARARSRGRKWKAPIPKPSGRIIIDVATTRKICL